MARLRIPFLDEYEEDYNDILPINSPSDFSLYDDSTDALTLDISEDRVEPVETTSDSRLTEGLRNLTEELRGNFGEPVDTSTQYKSLLGSEDQRGLVKGFAGGEDPDIQDYADTTSVANRESRLVEDASRRGLENEAEERFEENLGLYQEANLAALEEPRVGSGQMIGAGITTILPILLGAALAGKKGAYAGAESGFKGAGTQFALDRADTERGQKLEAAKAGQYLQLAKEASKDKARLKEGGIQAREREAIEIMREEGRDSRYGQRKGRSGEPLDPERQRFFGEALGLPPEQISKIQTLDDVKELRQLKDLERKAKGKGARAVSEKTTLSFADTKAANSQLKALSQIVSSNQFDITKYNDAASTYQGLLQEKGTGLLDFVLGGNQEKVLENDAFSRALSKLNPNSPEAFVFGRLRELGRQMALASEAGVLTEQDVQFYYQMYQPSAFESNETFNRRLTALSSRIDEKLQSRADALEAANFDIGDMRGFLSKDTEGGPVGGEERPVTLKVGGNLVRAYRQADGSYKDLAGNIYKKGK